MKYLRKKFRRQLSRPRKPFGHIRPDYNNPINNQLLAWWPLTINSAKPANVFHVDDVGSGNYQLQAEFADITPEIVIDNSIGRVYSSTDRLPKPSNGSQSIERTLSLWIKPDDSTQTDRALMGHFRSSFFTSYGLGLQYDNGDVRGIGTAGSSKTPLTSSLTDTSGWHHVVGVFSSSGRLYVDGELKASGDISDGYGYSFGLGAAVGTNNENTNRFQGQLDNPRMWLRRLDALEVRQLYLDPFYGAIRPYNKFYGNSVEGPEPPTENYPLFYGTNF